MSNADLKPSERAAEPAESSGNRAGGLLARLGRFRGTHPAGSCECRARCCWRR